MLLNRSVYFIKEKVAFAKLTDTYDILDPATQQPIGVAREEPPVWAKWLRLLVSKQLMPTCVNVYEAEGQPPVLSLQRGFSLLRAKVTITDGKGAAIGYLQSKIFSLGGGFLVFQANGKQIADVKGDWKGWNFKFLGLDGCEMGTVTKKWAGLGKELFTSADNYIISISETIAGNAAASALLLAAGLAIDTVYKEKN